MKGTVKTAVNSTHRGFVPRSSYSAQNEKPRTSQNFRWRGGGERFYRPATTRTNKQGEMRRKAIEGSRDGYNEQWALKVISKRSQIRRRSGQTFVMVFAIWPQSPGINQQSRSRNTESIFPDVGVMYCRSMNLIKQWWRSCEKRSLYKSYLTMSMILFFGSLFS